MTRMRNTLLYIFTFVNYVVLVESFSSFLTSKYVLHLSDHSTRYFGYHKPSIETSICLSRDPNDIDVLEGFINDDSDWVPPAVKPETPPPLNAIVDVNLERNSVVYECTLGRDLGFEVVQGTEEYAVVGHVSKLSFVIKLF